VYLQLPQASKGPYRFEVQAVVADNGRHEGGQQDDSRRTP
jgi:hypothetical protein